MMPDSHWLIAPVASPQTDVLEFDKKQMERGGVDTDQNHFNKWWKATRMQNNHSKLCYCIAVKKSTTNPSDKKKKSYSLDLFRKHLNTRNVNGLAVERRANGPYNFPSVLSWRLVYLEAVFILTPFFFERITHPFLMEVVLNEVAGQCAAVFVPLSRVSHLHGRGLGAVFQVFFYKSASEIN